MSTSNGYQPRIKRRDRCLEIRGINYHLSEWGDPQAPLLVYLHGWADTGTTFQFVVDALEHEWRIVAPDWRGFGDSARSVSSYWFPDYLADLDELLNRLSPNDPVRIVGHSMGANVAGLYAGTMPERVAAFVNIEGFGLQDSDPADAPGRYRAWIERSRAAESFSTYKSFDHLGSRIRQRNPRMTRAQAAFVARCWALEDDDGVVQLRADPRHKLPNPVLYRQSEAAACWSGITAPLLLVCGSDSEFRNQPFTDVPAVEIDLSGHMLHFEAPGELAHAMETFLRNTL